MDTSLSDEDFVVSSRRMPFLVTYSNVKREKLENKDLFAKATAEAFSSVGNWKAGKVLYYAACEEEHRDGSPHCHVSILLSSTRRWNPVREYISVKYVYFDQDTLCAELSIANDILGFV